MKPRPYSILLALLLLLPLFAKADLAEPNPLSPESHYFPFVVGGFAVIGVGIFVVVMMKRKKK